MNLDFCKYLKFLCFVVLVSSCFGEKSTVMGRIDSSDGTLQQADAAAEVDPALKIDAQNLKITSLNVVNEPIASRSQTDLRLYNVVVKVAADLYTLYVRIDVCDSSGVECTEHLPKGSTLHLEAVALPSTELLIKATPCTLAKYSTTQHTCGPSESRSHTLPDQSIDTRLQMLEGQRNSMRAKLAQWDPKIKEILENYQKDIDECLAKQEEYNRVETTRQLVNFGLMLLGSMIESKLSNSAVPPTSELVQEHTVKLAELRDSLATGTDSYKKAKELHALGYKAAPYYYYYRTYKQSNEAFKKARDLWQTMKGYSPTDYLKSAAGFFFPEPQGTITGFGIKAANAIYNLSATHVLLDCKRNKLFKDLVSMKFVSILKDTRSNLCELETMIKDRRMALSLAEPKFEEDSCKDDDDDESEGT